MKKGADSNISPKIYKNIPELSFNGMEKVRKLTILNKSKKKLPKKEAFSGVDRS